jgi:hypothetical protein
VKVLPLAAVFAVAPMTNSVLLAALGHQGWARDLFPNAIYLAVLTVIGLTMDLVVLRDLKVLWSRPWFAFRHAYGIQNVGGQVTFVLAQVAATLAIVTYLAGSPEPPAYPSVDPFQFSRTSIGN